MKNQIFVIISIISLVLGTPQSFAEDVQIGTPAMYKLEFVLMKSADVKVIYDIQEFSGTSHIKILDGNHFGLQVTTENVEHVEHELDENSFEASKYVILNEHPLNKPEKFNGEKLLVTYYIKDYSELKDELWAAQFNFPYDVIINLPDYNNWAFLNSNAVKISDVDKINCIGCNLMVEYFNDENLNMKTKTVSLNDKEDIEIDVLTDGNISNFEFNNMNKVISFGVEKENQIFVMGISLELLLNPYQVYLSESINMMLEENQKIRTTELFIKDYNSVALSFRAPTDGVIYILGGTEQEHEEYLSRITEPAQIPPSITEQPSHLPDEPHEQTWSEIMGESDVGMDVGMDVEQPSNQYPYIIFGGVIVAGIVFGLIFLIRKKSNRR